MTKLEQLKHNRTNSLIVVLTLGLATLFIKDVRPVWMFNIFKGTSIDNGPMGWIFQAISYIALGVLTAGIFFIIHLFKLLFLSIEIARHP